MKKFMALVGAALLLAGCDQNKGGMSDQYGTSSSNYNSSGAATSPGGYVSGSSASTNSNTGTGTGATGTGTGTGTTGGGTGNNP